VAHGASRNQTDNSPGAASSSTIGAIMDAQEIADFFARKHPNAIFIAQWRAGLTIKDKPCPNGIRIVDAAEIAGNIPFIAHLM
jgi:hypothetical protein